MAVIQPNKKKAYQSLTLAGFGKPFVREVLPRWWNDDILKTGSGMIEFAGLVKQRIGLVPQFDSDGVMQLQSNTSTTRLKQRTNTDPNKVQPTAALASAMARTALSHFPPSGVPLQTTISDAKQLRQSILDKGNSYVSLDALLEACWGLGIPVLRLARVPAGAHKAFGYSVQSKGRYAIIVGLNDARTARISFVVAHELGHIALGHVADGVTIADEVLSVIEESLERRNEVDQEERAADKYALDLLRGSSENVELGVNALSSASALALAALRRAEELRIDPGHLLLSHSFRSRNWPIAALAYRFLQEETDSVDLMKRRYINLLAIGLDSEDRDYLNTLQQYDLTK
jgi:hypothetical protein